MGISLGIIFNEISIIYNALLNGVEPSLSNQIIQYKDYAVWQNTKFTDDIINTQLNFWKNHLDKMNSLEFPLDYDRSINFSFNGNSTTFDIEKLLLSKLKTLALDFNTTLYTVLLSTFYVFLAKYTGQRDVVFGVPFANRDNKQLHNTLGLFVNTLPLHINLSDNVAFAEIVKKMHFTLLEIHENQSIPFERIVDELKIGRDGSRNPIFQILFELEFSTDTFTLSDVKATGFDVNFNASKFDLTFTVRDNPETTNFTIEYNSDLFKESTIRRLGEHYKLLLSNLSENPTMNLCDLKLLSDMEYVKIITDWNATELELPYSKMIHQLFEDEVEKHPDTIAVNCNGVSLTYAEVNFKANQLAHKLKQIGIVPDDFVIFLLDRGNEYLISMLGVWKSGAAFIPLNPQHPNEKNRRILEQVTYNALLTNEEYADNAKHLSGLSNKILILTQVFSENLSMNNLLCQSKPQNLAYVIFTSGSTGTPKGAMVQQDGMLNHLFAKIHDLNLTHLDHMAQIASQVFDVSVWQYMAVLLVGGQVTVFTEESAWDPIQLLPNIVKTGITDIDSLIESLTHRKPGQSVTVNVVRSGENRQIVVKLKGWYIDRQESQRTK